MFFHPLHPSRLQSALSADKSARRSDSQSPMERWRYALRGLSGVVMLSVVAGLLAIVVALSFGLSTIWSVVAVVAAIFVAQAGWFALIVFENLRQQSLGGED
ncbi:hypothetical protein EYW49_16780 [Siculibacillus lacustris]|uniref:Uncharacterized protein n=1 Tax=Siculibacillus lacustris TaxID=1549641 RepID=A0A4Q9VKN8_9HYPH|nr:hypothetical protein [Siculibacillus lacustris]TBW35104.1 hypothetical protein EYW49_16780 [Siculibacillus lacustris]